MNKKISIISFLFLAIMFTLGSCSDDNNNYEVSEEWKNYQEKVFADLVIASDETTGTRIYTPVKSESGMGSVYYRTSDYITNNQAGKFDPDGPTILPKSKSVKEEITKPLYDTDKVGLRYEGWYYNTNGKKVIFDTTETNNTEKERELIVGGGGSGIVDGFTTILLDMEVGEERIVCMPYDMGYGAGGRADNYGNVIVPGYTTMFFDIKLLRVSRD